MRITVRSVFPATLIAASLLAPAHAAVDPDIPFTGQLPYATNRGHICISGNCTSNPILYGATQSPDCNSAGIGIPSAWSSRPYPTVSGNYYDSHAGSYGGTGTYGVRGFGDGALNGLQYQRPSHGYMVFPSPQSLGINDWPGADTQFLDDGNPIKGSFNSDGEPYPLSGFRGLVPEGGINYDFAGAPVFTVPTQNYDSVSLSGDYADTEWGFELQVSAQYFDIGPDPYTTLTWPEGQSAVDQWLAGEGITDPYWNWCRQVQVPVDPHFLRTGRHDGGSWGQRQDDQWAIKRVGFTDLENSAWNLLPDTLEPVVVAVIDTGLDWHHADIDSRGIWRNPAEIPDNGIDDDDNGYVDDVIGWDFLAGNNKPWDFDGHGTIVAGIIAASHNDTGIAGINPNARIMVLKAVNNFGNTRASYLAEAIVYAADNGARIINLSVGGLQASPVEQAAIDYAASKGVLVIAASGNEGIELAEYGPGGNDKVLTVGATHLDDRAAAFSNFGENVDIIAPGVDVIGTRARFTDANYRPLIESDYELGDSYVGSDSRYIHASGTSFAAPIVAATASLIMAKNPSLSAAQVEERLLATAEDVELPGPDNYTGHGMVDARAALAVDDGFFLKAEITSAGYEQPGDSKLIQVRGTIDADRFKRAWMQIGPGDNPGGWKYVGQKRKYPIRDGVLGVIPVSAFQGYDVWQVVINVEHGNGVVRSARHTLDLRQ